MSKGKYKRKREHARQKAEQQANQVKFPHGEVIRAEKQPEPSKKSDSKRSKKKEESMRFGEAVKRSSFTDWCIATFTLALTVVAIYQLVVTSGQLDTMRKDQRPWLKISIYTPPNSVQENAIVIGTASLLNSGKTPAKNVLLDMAVQKLRSQEEPTLDFPQYHPTSSYGVIYPNDPQTAANESLPYGIYKQTAKAIPEYEPVTKDDFDNFRAGNLYYVVYGKVRYTDFFHTEHWTHFCNWVTAVSPVSRVYQAQKCTAYNDIDNN
jgi:hypothetical protein